jgi:DNA-binding MarR family transcriptional regulator
MVGMAVSRSEILEKLSFVLSSKQREKVLGAVLPGPRTPAQVARETGLRPPHVSRALAQLVGAGLVSAMPVGPRGKLYGTTDLGKNVFAELANTRGDRVVAPMVRGSHFKNYHHWITVHYGKERADSFFLEFGVDPDRIDPEGWYPLRTVVRVLESIEALFGDGSYETIRQLFREEAGNFSSIRRLLAHVLPLSLLLELAPSTYSREFNHGRLEVEVRGRRALLKNFDWLSSRARCMGWLGTYEAAIALSGYKGSVTKVACMLKGDPYCGYRIEW